MSKVDENKLRAFTDDQTYPTSKENLRASAASKNLDEEVMSLVNEIPDKTYSSSDEVIHAIREFEEEFQNTVWRTKGPNM
jgi:hypothetical protein